MFKTLIKIKILLLMVVFLFVALSDTFATTKESKDKDKVQRTYGVEAFDLQTNTVSNIQFYTTNYGIFGLDIRNNRGGGFWPRGSLNQYIFASGIWFGALKNVPGKTFSGVDTIYQKKLVEISYNPNSGSSWMVPGRITDGDKVSTDADVIKKYRTYFSTDFLRGTGTPRNKDEGPNWPIWDAPAVDENGQPLDSLKFNRFFGKYIDTTDNRNLTSYPRGPAFISGEDIFATFKDTDLGYFEGGAQLRKTNGYPMRLQFEHMIYSWGFGDYKDFIFMKYQITNTSSDTLFNCWMSPVLDVDIALKTNSQAGAANDRARFYDEDPSLNMALQWTNGDYGEKGKGFGYLGFDFLESPAVYRCDFAKDSVVGGVTQTFCHSCIHDTTWTINDLNGSRDTTVCLESIAFLPNKVNQVMKERKFYNNSAQLGLKTFRQWSIEEDLQQDEPRYGFMSSQVRDKDNGPGDKRLLMATGPFNLLPNDTVRVVFGLVLASTATKPDADGSTADVAELIRKDKFAQYVYDNNFRAPIPPDPCVIKWEAYNNSIKITWDSLSELSFDKEEKGFDFLGYRLFRARRSDLDTFDVNTVAPNLDYSSGKGPFGWKQIAQWEMPTPCWKSSRRSGNDPTNQNMPFIDSLRVIGPVIDPTTNKVDKFSIRMLRMGRGVVLMGNDTWLNNVYFKPAPNMKYFGPNIITIDTNLYVKPWGPFFDSLARLDGLTYPVMAKDIVNSNLLSYLGGTIQLNQAFLDYNPLFYDRATVEWDSAKIEQLNAGAIPAWDTTTGFKYLKGTQGKGIVNGNLVRTIDILMPVDPTKCMQDTARVDRILDSVYTYLQKGYAKAVFPDIEQNENIRQNILLPYMRTVTNNRTFYDIGDDNRSGEITIDENPLKTERILNNVEYYYKMLSYDEGDYSQSTERKTNTASDGLPNFAKAYAKASSPDNEVNFHVTYMDSTKMGGLHNFKMFCIDPDRATKLYAGHEFELEIIPQWDQTMIEFNDPDPDNPDQRIKSKARKLALYRREIKLTDITDPKNTKLVYDGNTLLEQSNCVWSYKNSFAENAKLFMVSEQAIRDTIKGTLNTFMFANNDERIVRSGSFTTGGFDKYGYCYLYPFSNDAYGNLGFSFDYTIEQRGGRFRPDPSSCSYGAATRGLSKSTTPIAILTDTSGADQDSNVVYRTQEIKYKNLMLYWTTDTSNTSSGFSRIPDRVYQSWNNGPGDYEITFKAGGKETMTVVTDEKTAPITFDVNYLTMDIKNTAVLHSTDQSGKAFDIKYPDPVTHMVLPTYYVRNTTIDVQNGVPDTTTWPSLINLDEKGNDFIGKYNLYANAMVNSRGTTGINVGKKWARPTSANPKATRLALGTQGRYYLTALSADGKDTIDFAHTLNIAGCQFIFDYARKGRRIKDRSEWTLDDSVKTYVYGAPDFAENDKITVKTTGGAFGYPSTGAKVRFKMEDNRVSPGALTDALMDQVSIAPNPYYITHQGQHSPYDAKIYFTRLPKICTIQIYTVMGELVTTIQHNETLKTATQAGEEVELWDLLTRNGQRVQSQTLVAVIKADNGAQTVKQFSVVVGGYRVLTTD